MSKIAPKRVHKSRELPKLVYWNMIEPLRIKPDNGARCSGTWRPLQSGIYFAKNITVADKYVYVYNKKVVPKSSRLILEPDHSTISIKEALEDDFDFDELWNEII